MSRSGTVHAFLDACETGKGWEVCKNWCHFGATFSCQEEPAANAITLAAYADWMMELLSRAKHGRYVLKSFAMFDERVPVVAVAKFHGTHTCEGGPIPPTGSSIVSDYTYIMEFSGRKICHLTKVWSDVHAVQSLVWSKRRFSHASH